ncbi:hypothetical protein F5B22DRAFT_1597 [Xylaria bambusicola]|uniref:uncharacterized protein n=1 Tax=Xylaria bambusicola TaxID=326684 RepID=UPI002007F6C7|nr:uncharacterized protein F5B22DRAFT_1597 [Xylaria bambusicola]KAI0527730.1 hypothetical protein F5B22DRAFT_1597 [Xylaria bambusicola]
MDPNRRHGSRRVESPDLAADLPDKPKDDGCFVIWFLEFSNAYNLNLRRPDSGFLSNEPSTSSYYDDSHFYERLQCQYEQGNARAILNAFAKAARAVHSQWVRKPRGERDVTPSSGHLPRASNETERLSLLEKLENILDLLESMYEPREQRSKRPPAGRTRTSPSPKRSRGVIDIQRPPSVVSRLDVSEVRSSSTIPESPVLSVARDLQPSPQQHVYGFPTSSNTSKSSLVSKVFTDTEEQVFPASQESEVTNVAESSGPRLKRPPSSLVDSLAPSTSTERLLASSFDEYTARERAAKELPTQVVGLNRPQSHDSLKHLTIDHHDHPIPSMEDDASHDYPFDTPNKPILSQEQPPEVRSTTTTKPPAKSFQQRLEDVWPIFPAHLHHIPLAVRWEVMRVALYCGVPMEKLDFEYEPSMNDQNNLWARLHHLQALEGKNFPERSRLEAWNAAINDHFCSTDQVVVLTASLTLNEKKVGPLFKLNLQPLRLDLPHRLNRRFGSDRFLEIIMPSPHEKKTKDISKSNRLAIIDAVHVWLAESCHFILGRSWRAFNTKQATAKKVQSDDILRPETKTIMQERIYLFAEDGNDFLRADATQIVSPKFEPSNGHTKMKREHLLDWLLQIQRSQKNQNQSIYKLFSRIALGLSRTRPTVILQTNQIRHRDEDILSPEGKVMNDGIGRMSTALVKKIRDMMGLSELPAGYQGRFGSAKGFWIRDTEDPSDDIWIETFPSQRKWDCDYEEEDHRTFEVRNNPGELRSAALNLQLLPILEDRAIAASGMKRVVGKFMKESLEMEMESQKQAMQDPAHFRVWVHENTAPQRRQERVRLGHVPWVAGLPTSREDQMELLLSQGFDPTKLEFLREISYKIRKQKCDELQTKLNVKVGRSTYAYMVIDFQGILEEDEVHLGFSSKFTDEQSGFSETFLHGMDVLVARIPAHYPSDIQRVKAVFKPELGSLKDVIIFPSKGNIPLADKLSGGDYDGDIAWVCWEPNIVNNFVNAPPPDVPDLFQQNVLTKKKDTYRSLAESCESVDEATTRFLDEAFRFNMEPNLLGTCTNYKEKLCYSRNSVSDEHAIFLSTLISNLVDRAKQGIVFTDQDWHQQRQFLNSTQADAKLAKQRLDPPMPVYKKDNYPGDSPSHIIDYLKFKVGKPTVEREMENFDRCLRGAQKYDVDLVKYFESFERLKRPSKESTWNKVLEKLQQDIHDVAQYWKDFPTAEKFDAKLTNTYEKWQAIEPEANTRSIRAFFDNGLAGVGLSGFDLLKASYCFKLYYSRGTFVWFMAGYQLGYLKCVEVSQGISARPVLVTPQMYAGVRPDAKFVRAVSALNDGRRYEQPSEERSVIEDLSDEDDLFGA